MVPSIIVSGASGFIGRHFLEATRDEYRIFALARRTQKEAGVRPHPNIRWIMVDIADRERLAEEFRAIEAAGGALGLLHLAGFYTFDRLRHAEYERTNVLGTKNILEAAERLSLRRFVFSSSVTVTDFRRSNVTVTEASPANADFPYARSMARAEELIREHAARIPYSIVRLAAVFSDWCEYGPLYMLLSNWFSERWNRRVLPGRGEAAIPYIHIAYVVALLRKIFEMGDSLPRCDTYLASSRVSLPVHELFRLATRFYFGEGERPLLVPRSLVCAGIGCRNLFGPILGARSRERLWMMRYVDRAMHADPSYTLATVPVRQRRRMDVDRRLVFLVENARNYPVEWHHRNAAALRRDLARPSLVVTDAMHARMDEIGDRIFARLSSRSELVHYRRMDPDRLRWYVQLVYNLLMQAARHGDRMSILSYARYLGHMRKREGYPLEELRTALLESGRVIQEALLEEPGLRPFEHVIYDCIRLNLQLAADEVEDVYDEDGEIPPFRRTAAAEPMLRQSIPH